MGHCQSAGNHHIYAARAQRTGSGGCQRQGWPASETMPAVDISNLIQTVLIYALPVLFAITVHEAAHGYAARHFGDNTAAMMGRITLNPRRDMIWVALAGPASNFVQALLWGVLLVVLVGSGVGERFFIEMCRAGILVNLVMWAFNLFPLPPLDGGRILVGLLPWRQAQWVSRIEPWGFFIVMRS